MKLSSKIDSVARQRVTELLGNPFAGSGGFEPYPLSAKYRSNCHGTMAYVFNLKRGLSHPIAIPADQMDDLILENFVISQPAIGSLAAFYLGSDFLVHTAMIVGNSEKVFHQKIFGGCFELGFIEEHKCQAQIILGESLGVKYFKRK